MNWSFTIRILLFALLLGSIAHAQNSCEYTLYLYDDSGDGWDGGTVNVTVAGMTVSYTLDSSMPFGATNTITVTHGDLITVEFVSNNIETEGSYILENSDSTFIFQDGTIGEEDTLQTGLVFQTIAVCPSCPSPALSSMDAENIRSATADITWVPGDPLSDFFIEYDTTGFEPGTGNFKMASGNSVVSLFNLEEKTLYDVYLTAICPEGDTTNSAGPFTFETLWRIDVGISEILSPVSGCNLGINDSIELLIANFGGEPQSLIPFTFSVDGVEATVNMPNDGLFTGVVGTDSMEIAEFDATFDFSEPGEYLLQIYTQLEGDAVPENDTATVVIVSVPEVTSYPYFDDFESWNGGWSVESEEDAAEPTWAYGTPAGTIISGAASGSNAWVTNLNGEYNNDEISYLVSPCFDFSSLSTSPRLAFNMNFDTESCCDEGWVDISVDDGETWQRVQANGTDINWYNDTFNEWWDGNGGFTGWAYVQTILAGTAGESDVRIRFGFSSDFSVPREGMGIDNVSIAIVGQSDFAASQVSNTTLEVCGSPNDEIEMRVINVGTSPQVIYDLSYSINGAPAVTEAVTNGILPGGSFTYTFDQTFDSSEPGTYEIKAWVNLPGDEVPFNDTITFTYQTATEVPIREDFEEGIPTGWTTDFSFSVSDGHNNTSNVIHVNLYEFNQTADFSTVQIGPIAEEDTLRFDYRFVNFSFPHAAADLSPGDSLVVELSIDCEAPSFFPIANITEANHTASEELATVEVPLAAYEDLFITIRFRGVFGGDPFSDYWLDIDNINIRRCPENLALTANIINASAASNADGAITITPGAGEGPFEYVWNTGDSTKTVTGLEPGDYKVTVTDVYGCQDILDVTVLVSSVFEPGTVIDNLLLAPNPTGRATVLQTRFARPVEARVQVFSPVGQLLQETLLPRAVESNLPIDLTNYESGFYFVRVIADGEMRVLKLVKAR